MKDNVLLIDYSSLLIDNALDKIHFITSLYDFFCVTCLSQDISITDCPNDQLWNDIMEKNQHLCSILKKEGSEISKLVNPKHVVIAGIKELFADLKKLNVSQESTEKNLRLEIFEKGLILSDFRRENLVEYLISKWGL